MHEVIRISSDELLEKLKSDPRTMDLVCSHVAAGGSLVELCEVWDVSYGRFMTWLREDRERSRRYVDAQNDRGEWFKDKVLLELRKISEFDFRDVLDANGQPLPIKSLPKNISSCIKSVKETKYGTNIEGWDKLRSLELIGKNLSMFIEKIEVSGKLTLEDLVTQSREEDERQEN